MSAGLLLNLRKIAEPFGLALHRNIFSFDGAVILI
jgi:hypothetical protein